MIWQEGGNVIVQDDSSTITVTFTFRANGDDRKKILSEIKEHTLIKRMM